MEQHDETLDQIRAFLKGRLSPAEEAAFKAKMKADPALEDKVAFAKILMGGLEEVVVQQKNSGIGRRNLTVLLLLMALTCVLLFLFFRKSENPDTRQPNIQRVTENASRHLNTIVEQGGGSSNTLSDRANAVVWNKKGEVVLGGQFKGPAVFGNIDLLAIGGEDVFLATYALDQGYIWAKAFGSKAGITTCNNLSIDKEDNILMTGKLFD